MDAAAAVFPTAPRMLDIWLGTVDRDDLEKEWMRPERMLWCEKGIDWIRDMARNGAGGVSEHPGRNIDEVSFGLHHV